MDILFSKFHANICFLVEIPSWITNDVAEMLYTLIIIRANLSQSVNSLYILFP